MLSCKKATELMSKKEVQNLSIIERAQLKIHSSMCKACSSYEKQTETINKTLSKISNIDTVEKQSLTDDFKQSIINKIKTP